MIIKEVFKNAAPAKYLIIDNIDKIIVGRSEQYNQNKKIKEYVNYINIFRKGRIREDECETIEVVGMTVYVMNDAGKTLSVHRENNTPYDLDFNRLTGEE